MPKPKKKGGLGSFISNIFVESVETDEDDVELTAEEEAEFTKAAEAAAKETKSEIPKVAVNQEIVSVLQQLLEDNNLDGYDYFEFVHAVNKADLPSEKQKFEMMYSAIEGLPGMSPDHLITTGNHYLQKLQEHKANFESNVTETEAKSVVALEDKAEQTEAEITRLAESIEAAKEQMAKLAKEKDNYLEQASSNRKVIEAQKSEYGLVWNAFTTGIIDNQKKIEKYLK